MNKLASINLILFEIVSKLIIIPLAIISIYKILKPIRYEDLPYSRRYYIQDKISLILLCANPIFFFINLIALSFEFWKLFLFFLLTISLLILLIIYTNLNLRGKLYFPITQIFYSRKLNKFNPLIVGHFVFFLFIFITENKKNRNYCSIYLIYQNFGNFFISLLIIIQNHYPWFLLAYYASFSIFYLFYNKITLSFYIFISVIMAFGIRNQPFNRDILFRNINFLIESLILPSQFMFWILSCKRV